MRLPALDKYLDEKANNEQNSNNNNNNNKNNNINNDMDTQTQVMNLDIAVFRCANALLQQVVPDHRSVGQSVGHADV